MSSIMEAVAMNTVIETAQEYREKIQVKKSSGYLKNYLPKNNTQLLKYCTLLGKKRCIISVQLCIVQLMLWTWLGEQLMKSAHLHHLQDLRSLDHPALNMS